MLGLFKMEFLVGELYVLVFKNSAFSWVFCILVDYYDYDFEYIHHVWFTHIVTLSGWDFIIRFGTVK